MDTFEYFGVGNSTNKKDAQSNASRDFVNFLVRQGFVNVSDVPADAGIQAPEHHEPPQNSYQQRPVFGEGMGPNQLGEAYRPYRNETGYNAGPWDYRNRIQEQQEQKRMEEAEDLDVNASIHGGWTVENAKSKLHQFLQSNKINSDYKYTSVGPDHTRYNKFHFSYTNS